MSTKDSIIDAIRGYRIDKAFVLLDELFFEIDDINLIVLKDSLKSQYNRYTLNSEMGTEEKRSEENGIIKSLLTLVHSLDEKHINRKPIVDTNSNDDENNNPLNQLRDRIDNLSYKSTQEDISEIITIKDKIVSEYFGEYDTTIINIPILKPKKVFALFDKIFASSKLSASLIEDINSVRRDTSNYEKHDRILIVSSILCSIINYKDFDPSKVDLIIDFILDGEEEVKSYALASLVIGLIFHNSRWQRFGYLKNRIGILKLHPKIQDDLILIEFVLSTQLYQSIDFGSDIFGDQIYRENIAMCFLPFNREAPLVKEAIKSHDTPDELNSIVDRLTKFPALEVFKYSVFNSILEGSNSTQEDLTTPEIVKESKHLMLYVRYLQSFGPYVSIMSNIFYFYKYYPTPLKVAVFQKELSISTSKLKNYILNDKQKHLISGRNHMEGRKFKLAINSYKEVLVIDNSNKIALRLISYCYSELENFKDAIKYGKLFLSKEENNYGILCDIVLWYTSLKDYISAKKFVRKCFKHKKSKKNGRAYYVEGFLHFTQKDFISSIDSFTQSNRLSGGNSICLSRIGDSYFKLEDYENALKFHLKSIELAPERKHIYLDISGDYAALLDFKKAEFYVRKYLEYKKNDEIAEMMLGRFMIFNGGDHKKSKELLNKAIKKKEVGVTYGNLGHWELLFGSYKNAVTNYKKCLSILNSTEDFKDKMNIDKDIMTERGVTPKLYEKAIEETTRNFVLS